MVKRLRTIGLASAFIAVQRRRVVPVEAGHAQVGAVAGTEQALFREEGEGIRADEAAECLHVQPVGDQFRFRGNVDAVEAGVLQGRRGDAQVYAPGSGVPEHLHELPGSGSPDDGVVDDHDVFSPDDASHGRQLQPHAGFPHLLGGLDEGAAHVEILDDTHFQRDAAPFGIADGGAQAGVRDAEDHVGLHGVLLVEDPSGFFPEGVDIDPFDVAVGTGEIDVFHRAEGVAAEPGPAAGPEARGIGRNQFAGLYIADIPCPDGAQGAGFAAEDKAASQPTDGQRAEAVLVTGGIEPVRGQDQVGEGALDPVEGEREGIAGKGSLPVGRHLHQMPQDFAVGGGAEQDFAAAHRRFQLLGIDDVPVMGDGVVVPVLMEGERLDVVRFPPAGRPVPDMADGAAPRMASRDDL